VNGVSRGIVIITRISGRDIQGSDHFSGEIDIKISI
jgi:hypothetical protein